MEFAYALTLIVGLGAVAFYQNNQIKVLGKQLAVQSSVLDQLKVYLDLFDPDQLQGWIERKQLSVEEEDDREIEKMCTWMAGVMQERLEAGQWKEREITAATDLIIRLLFYAPSSVREMSMKKMPNSMFKDAVRKVFDRLPDSDQLLPPRGTGLSSKRDPGHA